MKDRYQFALLDQAIITINTDQPSSDELLTALVPALEVVPEYHLFTKADDSNLYFGPQANHQASEQDIEAAFSTLCQEYERQQDERDAIAMFLDSLEAEDDANLSTNLGSDFSEPNTKDETTPPPETNWVNNWLGNLNKSVFAPASNQSSGLYGKELGNHYISAVSKNCAQFSIDLQTGVISQINKDLAMEPKEILLRFTKCIQRIKDREPKFLFQVIDDQGAIILISETKSTVLDKNRVIDAFEKIVHENDLLDVTGKFSMKGNTYRMYDYSLLRGFTVVKKQNTELRDSYSLKKRKDAPTEEEPSNENIRTNRRSKKS